jgi:hypothetical protein
MDFDAAPPFLEDGPMHAVSVQSPGAAHHLEGDLDVTAFPEVLGRIGAEASTGRLEIDAGGTLRRLDFVAGDLVGVDGDPVSVADASAWVADVVLELCALPSGSYRFDAGPPAPASVHLSADELLAGAEERVGAWREVTRHVPSTNAVPRLAPEPPSPEPVVIAADDWPVLALVDGQRSVGDVIVQLQRRPFEVCECLARLVVSGAVVVDYRG